jgi:hypothetical protein
MIMTVTIDLSAETERLLQEKATKAGQTLEGYLQAVAEREARTPHGNQASPAPLTAQEWSAQWRAWANADRQLPSGIVIDDSRERIYAGRGE